MLTSPVAGLLLGYTPVVDRQRKAIATRLALRAGESPLPALGPLYRGIVSSWPGHAAPVLLDLGGRPLTGDVLELGPSANVWLEFPAEQAAMPGGLELAAELHRKGFGLVLRGRTESPLPAELLPAFRLAIIHAGVDRRLGADTPKESAQGFKRTIPYAQDGVDTLELMERCFGTGAASVIGWPFQDALVSAGKAATAPDLATISELLQMIDRDEEAGAMETVIRRDPSLAYRLLRYVNSPGVGLRVEIQSFRHAVAILGLSQLKRWLCLLLVTSSNDANMRPVMFASFRRGLLLERLIEGERDETMRDEVFILGVFSLLDKLFKQPFEALLEKLQVPERVEDTLLSARGPYRPYLDIVDAVENGPSPALMDRLTSCLVSLDRCNDAVMRALTVPEAGT